MSPRPPEARECAILLLLLMERKAADMGKEIVRMRVSELTLKRLWSRGRLNDALLSEVGEFLHRAGWALFYSGRTFAMVRAATVDQWTRVSSKHMKKEIEQAWRGQFAFEEHYDRLFAGQQEADDD